LLKKFFLNSNTKAYLRGLEAEFGESSNGIRIELNRFEKAGLLKSEHKGNRKLYYANRNHPLFPEIHKIIMKETGIYELINKVVNRIGNLVSVYVTGDFARGYDSNIIDIILVGENIDKEYLESKKIQAESITGRKVRYALYGPEEEKLLLENYKPEELLLLWDNDTGYEKSGLQKEGSKL